MKNTSADSSRLTDESNSQAASSVPKRTYRKLVGAAFDSSDNANNDRISAPALTGGVAVPKTRRAAVLRTCRPAHSSSTRVRLTSTCRLPVVNFEFLAVPQNLLVSCRLSAIISAAIQQLEFASDNADTVHTRDHGWFEVGVGDGGVSVARGGTVSAEEH